MQEATPVNIRKSITVHVQNMIQSALKDPCPHDDKLVSYGPWTGTNNLSRTFTVEWYNAFGRFPREDMRTFVNKSGYWDLMHISTRGTTETFVIFEFAKN